MTHSEKREAQRQPSLVVGLGGSSGALAALTEFFEAAPPGFGAAYVIVVHLAPEHESQLASILASHTTLPVLQVTERARLLADHVYVIAPNRGLEVVDGTLVVTDVTRQEQRRAPIDIFFRTLATAHQEAAVGIVLSGAGSDGALGLQRIKEQGGLTLAQAPQFAEFRDMPTNAIATGGVDLVLPVAQMPAALAEYHARIASIARPQSAAAPDGDDAAALRKILALLRLRTGHDFSNYKQGTLRRRLQRRLGVTRRATFSEYADVLHESPDEPNALMKDLLISVTQFFRDRDSFETLRQRVVPRLFEHRTPHDHARVWVAGCATGEEAYSIAMLLAEHAETLEPSAAGFQVFGTDLDEGAIAVARTGLYTEHAVADVDEGRLQQFFVREREGFRVTRQLRERVLFAPHNLIADPPFSHVDLISCRNVLIYLNKSAQERVYETFQFALRPGRFLFLGASENMPSAMEVLFGAFEKSARIYQSLQGGTRVPTKRSSRTRATPQLVPPPAGSPKPTEQTRYGELHYRLVERHSPPSILVTREHEIVHVSEHAGTYLRVAPGELSRDVLKMVRPELRDALRSALDHVARERTPVTVRGLRVTDANPDREIAITVESATPDDASERGLVIVYFNDGPRTGPWQTAPLAAATHAEPASRELQNELERVKAQLRATIEQYESHVEDARGAKEELHAMIEEQQAASEELETNREELQSVNEELSTVNQELKIKIDELTTTNDDFLNLIHSTGTGTVFLDRQLRLKLSTPGVQRVFRILPTDIGRPLSDLANNLVWPTLHEDVASVLSTLQTTERELAATDGRWYVARVLPYRTADDRIEGVALTFHDVTQRRRAEFHAARTAEKLSLVAQSALDYALLTTDEQGFIDSWSPGAERVFGYLADETIGQSARLLFTAEDRAAGVPERELETARVMGRAEDERWHLRKDGTRIFCSGVTTRLLDGEERGFAKVARDLTERHQAAEREVTARAELERRVMDRTRELHASVAEHAQAREAVVDLMHRLVNAQEEERRRIARDLHDQLGQQLTALRLILERHRDECAVAHGEQGGLEPALQVARDLDDQIDFLAWELRPPMLDDLGLQRALPVLVERWAAHYQLRIQTRFVHFDDGLLSPDAAIVFYRVVQEALTNIAKHAHAANVSVLLELRDDEVRLLIEDDGIGFNPAAHSNGLGLVGIRERAAMIGATVDIESSDGGGTSLYVRYPVLRPSP